MGLTTCHKSVANALKEASASPLIIVGVADALAKDHPDEFERERFYKLCGGLPFNRVTTPFRLPSDTPGFSVTGIDKKQRLIVENFLHFMEARGYYAALVSVGEHPPIAVEDVSDAMRAIFSAEDSGVAFTKNGARCGSVLFEVGSDENVIGSHAYQFTDPVDFHAAVKAFDVGPYTEA